MIKFELVARNLIAYFVERQRLVMLAMLDIEPGMLMLAGDNIAGIYLPPYAERHQEKLRQLKAGESFQVGTWNSEWKYFQHGIGCMLKNIHTNEPLEWDAPDINVFNFGWFMQHLQWRIGYSRDDPYIALFLQSNYTQSKDFHDFIIENNIVVMTDDGYKLNIST